MAQTAAQICATACNIAGAPSYLAIAGQALNEVLADICQTQDFDYARGTFNFNFVPGMISTLPSFPQVVQGGGPYNLPADWLRARYGDVMFFDQGVPHRLIAVDMDQFDMQVQQAGLMSYPLLYATDLSLEYSAVPVMVVYNPPNSNYPVMARYQRLMPDIATPETSATVPWFPYTKYLVEATAAGVMRETDDERWQSFELKAASTMDRILRLANDNSNRAKTVKLDPRRFGPDINNLPLTKQIWI